MLTAVTCKAHAVSGEPGRKEPSVFARHKHIRKRAQQRQKHNGNQITDAPAQVRITVLLRMSVNPTKNIYCRMLFFL